MKGPFTSQTAKITQVAASLLTSRSRLVIIKPISMCSHGLRQRVDDKSVVESCRQTFSKLVVKTPYPQAFMLQVISTSCSKFANASSNKPDFNRLDKM